MSQQALTTTHSQIVWGIEQGMSYEEIADHLGIHHDTEREHERRLRKRYGVKTRLDLPAAVRRAHGNEVIDGPRVAA